MEMTQTQYIDGSIVFYPQERNIKDIVGEKDFWKKAMQEFGYRILRGSAAGYQEGIFHEDRFRNILKRFDLERIVEIGTWRGLSAAILAHYAEHVTTIDIRYYEEPKRLWFWAGVEHKVKQIICESNTIKQQVIAEIDFDFAFIDGMHKYHDVKLDFECVKKCGRVLFHDYCEKSPEVMAFVDELDNVEIIEPFALWISPK